MHFIFSNNLFFLIFLTVKFKHSKKGKGNAISAVWLFQIDRVVTTPPLTGTICDVNFDNLKIGSSYAKTASNLLRQL